MRNLPRFDGRSSFSTWAYRIATNASLDELRKRERRPHLAVDDDHVRERPDATAQHPMEQLGDQLLLDDALARLPEDLRVAVVLRDVANLDYSEIAETLDIPIGTVKSRISRGRSALAELLRLDLADPLPPDSGNQTHPDERQTDRT